MTKVIYYDKNLFIMTKAYLLGQKFIYYDKNFQKIEFLFVAIIDNHTVIFRV